MFSSHIPWSISAIWISLTALTIFKLWWDDAPATVAEVLHAPESR